MNNLLIIGIDSASFDLIGPWLEQGKLPHLDKLRDRGVFGELKSVVPPMSPPAWTSFATGKNPGKHGIFDFTVRRPGSYGVEFINAKWRRAETIWKRISDAGKRVCTIALPISYPPEELNGAVISGIDTPGAAGGIADPTAFHPRELHTEITKKVGPYLISPNLVSFGDEQSDAMLEAALKTISSKMETALYLFGKEPWDCFMVVVGETDGISHRLWKYHDESSPFAEGRSARHQGEDPLLRVYQKVDEYVGKLCGMASPDTTILVMSDHGHGGNSTKAIFLNHWLREQRFLQFTSGGNGDKSVSSLLHRLFSTQLQWAKTFGLKSLPPDIKKKLLRKTNLASRLESALRFSNIDWSQTKAYSEETPYHPTIWINLQGREPEGIVLQEEYERVREEIIRGLYRWLDPETVRPVVKRVHKREELFSGPFVDNAPDLMIEWSLDQGYSYLFKKSKPGNGNGVPISRLAENEIKKSKSGDHRDCGLFIAAGGGIRKQNEIKGADLIDLAPTILYLLGLAIPSDMDGEVLTPIIAEEYLAGRPILHGDGALLDPVTGPVQGYSAREEEAISERLRGLGYIE